MTDIKRDITKIIRDGAKSCYNKGSSCRICNSTENLQFHHFKTLSILVNNWLRKNKISVSTLEEVQALRQQFIEEYKQELYDDTVTLCKTCHNDKLHKVYGKNPPLATAEKQKRWVERQREKHGLN